MKKILFITNGHGEDIVAAQIIKSLKSKRLKIDVLPVVGKGEAFKGLKVNIVGPKKVLPSGGFGLRNFSYFIKDLFSGLLIKVIRQIMLLRASRNKYDLVIGIGDIVPIIYSIIAGGKFIFIGINKSSYYKKLAFNYIYLEKMLLKKYSKLVFARDKKTTIDLSAFGIKAVYAGNPMMDMEQTIRSSVHQNIRKGKKKVIGFLPGTREDAYKNIEDFTRIIWQINKANKDIKFILSFPKMLDKNKLIKMILSSSIQIEPDFNKVLRSSSIIIGLSGTGNEQAAGLGIPVLAFPGRGAQYNYKFAKAQKELLGDSLMLLPRNSEAIATAATSLLFNNKLYNHMTSAGKERMGLPGASKKISNIIIKELN